MGYRLNRLDEPIFMAVPKTILTEFGIYYRLENCGQLVKNMSAAVKASVLIYESE